MSKKHQAKSPADLALFRARKFPAILNFDLEAYLARYSGYTRAQRLLHIVSCCARLLGYGTSQEDATEGVAAGQQGEQQEHQRRQQQELGEEEAKANGPAGHDPFHLTSATQSKKARSQASAFTQAMAAALRLSGNKALAEVKELWIECTGVLVSEIKQGLMTSTYRKLYSPGGVMEALRQCMTADGSSDATMKGVESAGDSGAGEAAASKAASGSDFYSRFAFDENWVSSTEARVVADAQRLETDLSRTKKSAVRESIRMASNDLGMFHLRRADPNEALRNFQRLHHYCTAPKHVFDMAINVMRTQVYLGRFDEVPYNEREARAQAAASGAIASGGGGGGGGGGGNKMMKDSMVSCLMSLSQLHARDYKAAARTLTAQGASAVSIDLGSSFNDVLCLEDVTVIGSLCAAATFGRSELRNAVLNNAAFRNFLELVPAVREMLSDLVDLRYSSCLYRLASLRVPLLLDLHLCSHAVS